MLYLRELLYNTAVLVRLKTVIGSSLTFSGFGHKVSHFLAINVMLDPYFFQVLSTALRKLHSGSFFYYAYRFFSSEFFTFISVIMCFFSFCNIQTSWVKWFSNIEPDNHVWTNPIWLRSIIFLNCWICFCNSRPSGMKGLGSHKSYYVKDLLRIADF